MSGRDGGYGDTMSENTTGRPFDGRNDRPGDEIPGETPGEETVHAPASRASDDERASRAPDDGGTIEDADVHDLQPSQEAGATLGDPATEAEAEGDTDR
jgi:hypothetical protein